MVCTICRSMLEEKKGEIWQGTYDLRYNLPVQVAKLKEQCFKENCGICRALLEGTKEYLINAAKGLSSRRDSFNLGSQQAEDSVENFDFTPIEKLELEIFAALSAHQDRIEDGKYLYRLEVTLQECNQVQKQTINSTRIRIQRTFLLESPSKTLLAFVGYLAYMVPETRTDTHDHKSPETSSREVFETAIAWMQQCKCAVDGDPEFYPTRLISLETLKSDTRAKWEHVVDPSSGIMWQKMKKYPEVQVKLVDTPPWFPKDGGIPVSGPGKNSKYVTLSHCWGGSVDSDQKLTSDTEEKLYQGIRIRELPQTFQDAIHFAALIDGVGYIWIDSLCIRQKDEKDWLHQSGDMDRVYSATYLNISATASSHSGGGLFKSRNPNLLREEHVVLNIEGLPGAFTNKGPNSSRLVTRSCTVLDATFWAERVNEAPVNTRGWVVQERILSPRVLHFCRDQIAWECQGTDGRCKGYDHAEGQPRGLSKFKVTSRGIIQAPRLKSVHIAHHLSSSQSQSSEGTLRPTKAKKRALREWTRIIETYSKTSLTNKGDKLIALTGMAKNIFKQMYGDPKDVQNQYVAGLWQYRLEDQLLWRVEPLFEPIKRTFSNPAISPAAWSTVGSEDYRAPSFSWAAIDTDGHGIVYGVMTNQKLFIRIDNDGVMVDTGNASRFGLIKDAKITLWCKLRAATIESTTKGRYVWRLHGRGESQAEKWLHAEDHTEVYLDCIERDQACIRDPEKTTGKLKKIYVVPAAIDQGGELTCLLLRLENEQDCTFRRIGLTKLSSFMDKLAMAPVFNDKNEMVAEHKILEVLDLDIGLPHDNEYDEIVGEHRIHLI